MYGFNGSSLLARGARGPYTGTGAAADKYLRTVLRSYPVRVLIALTDSPCRFSSWISRMSPPRNRGLTSSPRRKVARLATGGDFYSGVLSIFSQAATKWRERRLKRTGPLTT